MQSSLGEGGLTSQMAMLSSGGQHDCLWQIIEQEPLRNHARITSGSTAYASLSSEEDVLGWKYLETVRAERLGDEQVALATWRQHTVSIGDHRTRIAPSNPRWNRHKLQTRRTR